MKTFKIAALLLAACVMLTGIAGLWWVNDLLSDPLVRGYASVRTR